MLAAVLIPLLCPQSEFDHPVDGLLNGDFEAIDNNGVTSGGSPVDGSFWIGAEDRTFLRGTNRMLGLAPGAQVLQRIGTAKAETDSLVVSGTVLLGNNLNQLELSVSDGPVAKSTMNWFLRNGDATYGSWSFDEIDSTGQLVPMIPNAGADTFEGTLNPVSRFAFGKNTSTARIDDVPILTRWTSSQNGRVRILLRTTMHPNTAMATTTDIGVRVWKSDGASWSPTLVESIDVDNGDEGGPVFVLELDVAAGDQVAFEFEPLQPNSPTSTVYISPTVTFFGRTLTYFIGSPNLYLPVSTPTHHYTRVSTADFQAGLDAGADFAAVFGEGPLPAVQLDLRASVSNTALIACDDLSGTIDWKSRTPADLRQRILDEGQWVRSNHATVPTAAEVPYACGALYLDGSHVPSSNGTVPVYLEEMLGARFDRADFEQLDFIRQRELRLPLVGSANLQYISYDCDRERYRAHDCNSNNKVGVVTILDNLVDDYRKSGDPAFLDVGLHHAVTLATQGVVDLEDATDPDLYERYGDSCDGLIFTGNYDLCTGDQPSSQADRKTFLNKKAYSFATSPATMMRFYAEARAFNEGLPTGSPERFPTGTLDQIRTAARTALDVAIQVRNNNHMQAGYPSPDNWGGNWLVAHGTFNDLYGYQANQARNTYYVLKEKSFGQPGPNMDPFVIDFMNSLWRTDTDYDIVWDGAQHVQPFWTQIKGRSGYAAADQGRAYPNFNAWATDPDNLIDERRYFAEQLVEQGYVAAKLLEPAHTTWVNSSNDWFELPDLGGGNGAGTGIGPPDHWLAVQLQAYDASRGLVADSVRDDLLAHTNTILETAKDTFGVSYGYLLNLQWVEDLANGVTQLSDYFAGAERRTVGTVLQQVHRIDAGLPEAPSVEVTPKSLTTSAPTTAFTIEVTHPGSGSGTTALTQSTIVYLWREPNPGGWERIEIWPNAPAGVTWGPPVSGVGSDTAEMTLQSVAPNTFGIGDVKISAVTYDPDLQWDWDTSMQEW